MSEELREAISTNDEKRLKQLLDNPDIDINFKYESKSRIEGRLTPLHSAAAMGYLGIVKILLENKKTDPVALTDFQSTPLHLAAMGRHPEICKLLLPLSNPISLDNGKNTAYNIAKNAFKYIKEEDKKLRAKQIMDLLREPTFFKSLSRLELFKQIVDKTNVNDLFKGATPLVWACSHLNGGTYEIVSYLLKLPGIDVNALSTNGLSPLQLICGPKNSMPNVEDALKSKVYAEAIAEDNKDLEIGHIRDSVASELIKHGANVNYIKHLPPHKLTPLFAAVLFDRLIIVQNLLRTGVDLNVEYPMSSTKETYTILQLAEILNRKAIYLWLRNHIECQKRPGFFSPTPQGPASQQDNSKASEEITQTM